MELAAGILYGAGANVPAKGNCSSPEALAVEAFVQPNAKASVYASAYGGWLGIVEAGIEAELDLVKIGVPVYARAGLKPASGSEPAKLVYDLEGKLTLSTLSGHIDACGCFTIFCGCAEVFSWPGKTLASTDLFHPVKGSAPVAGF